MLRSGKAFGTVGASGGDTLPFPLPGTLAGALRGAYGDEQKVDFSKGDKAVEDLKKIRMRGPFFAKLSPSGQQLSLLMPRPLDAAYLQHHDKEQQLKQLLPQTPARNAEYADLPEGILDALFLPVGASKNKPADGPMFWHWKELLTWLSNPAGLQGSHLSALGTNGPATDVRTHVVIETATQHALDTGLFQSAGADFGPRREKGRGWEPDRYGVVAALSKQLKPGYIKFGGEGRLSHVEAAKIQLPDIPKDLLASLKGKTKLRMLLATPGLYDDGWKPAWLKNGGPPGCEKFQLELKAAAIDRAQPVSGWDMTKGAGGAKPARRMAPAGSVYWLETTNKDLDAAALADKLWLTSVSDNIEDRHDGYGLALFGVWD